MRVVLLHDRMSDAAREDERDVLVQMDTVEQTLRGLGHDPSTEEFTLNLGQVAQRLVRAQPDLVFNLVESVEGRGSLIYLAPALLDSLKIPYTGAATEAMFMTSNKLITKGWLVSSGIATPPWLSLDTLNENRACSAGPWIIKSVWEEASVGLDEDNVVRVSDTQELRGELERRQDSLGGEGFAESYIDGREFNISLLAEGDGFTVLPVAEMVFPTYAEGRPKVIGYRAKWDEESIEYRQIHRQFGFPPADAPLIRQLADIAGACWKVFHLEGYARVDFRVDAGGRPWVLEINTNPCLSPDAGFVAAAEIAGLSYADVIMLIVESAVRRSSASCAASEPVACVSG